MGSQDRTTVNVLNDTAPSVTLPENAVITENTSGTIIATINSGRPAANLFTYAFYNSEADATSEDNARTDITATLTPALTTADVTDQDINVTFTAPDIDSVDALSGTIYLRLNLAITGQTDTARHASAHDICAVRITNLVSATVSIAASFNHFEAAAVNLAYTFNPGSPTCDEFQFKFYPTASDASNDTNQITAGVPTPTFTHTAFATLATRSTASEESGTIDFTTPTVSADKTYYCRLEILRDGTVEASITTALNITNEADPSINISNVSGVEGSSFIVCPMSYVSGAPTARAITVSYHASLADARADRNALLTGTPALTSRPVPVSASGTHTDNIYMSNIPYVDADTTIYWRANIHQGSSFWYDTATLTIYNREESSIDMPESIDVAERSSTTATGTYKTELPNATAFAYNVYPNEEDYNNEANELTGENQPLTIVLSPTAPENSGAHDQARVLTATISAPAVSRDEDYWIKWTIVQPEITSDP